MKTVKLLSLLIFLTGFTSFGQIKKASLSPQVAIQQMVGMSQFSLEYGVPSRRDRKVFGGLIPYGKVWRTGANASTKVKLDRKVSFGGKDLPAGEYALYSIPAEKQWTIILSKNTELWGAAGYNEKDDFLRVTSKVIPLKDVVESLSIRFDAFHANGADLIIEWEYTQVRIPVFIDSDEEVMAEIEEKVLNAKGEISAQTYYDAAVFYYEKKKSLKQAVKWFDKAIELLPEAFWYVYYRAEISFFMEDYKQARTYIDDCYKAASEASADYGYVAKCRLLIDQLEQKGF